MISIGSFESDAPDFMRRTPYPITRILHQKDTGLRNLAVRVRILQNLGNALKRCIPANLAAHAEVANLRGQVLVISADSAAWATRLRYHRKAVLRHLSAECGVEIRDMRIKISPRQELLRQVSPPEPPGPEARQNMLEAAERITDPELAGAMRKLAENGKPGD